MQVGILGPLVVLAEGRMAQIGGSRLRVLLVRLSLDPGHLVTIDALASAVWPEGGPADPANAIQTLVSRLRRALPRSQILRSAPGGYWLDVPPDAVDAVRFERLLREGRRALRGGEPALAAHLLREALGLWRGEALAGVSTAPFAAAAAVRLDELRLTAAEDRVEADLQTSRESSHLVAELRELAAANPLRERLRLLLLTALRADGRTAEALAAYDDYRRLVADELGADPGPEIQRAHLALLRGQDIGPQPGGGRPQGNLREPLTSFVDRDEERARIAGQLVEARLVTLVGPGGAGKTRLATIVAADLAADLPGGAWLVELGPVVDAVAVAGAAAAALGLRDEGPPDTPSGPREPLDRLVDALVAAESLVVLDGCEHLLDATARLAENLLGRCRRLRILATSREPLGILGEALSPVPPLAVPGPSAQPAEALESPAVRLFADRAAAVQPGFVVDASSAGVVAAICRRLDGLPLAIELAAARLRTLPVEEVATRLDDRFRLLTGGSRTALPRHRTLRAAVEWSWSLLDGDERRLVERLAVFPAAFSPEAAASVGARVDAVPDALAALVDKSLLQVVPGPEPRYRMLETIREYGLERLAEHGEVADARRAHAAHFRALAEAAEAHLRGPGQVPWMRRLVVQRDDLLAALGFAADTGDADTALLLAATLGLMLTIRGSHAEAAARLRPVLGLRARSAPAAWTTAAALYLFNAMLSGGHASALSMLDELRARLEDLDPAEVGPAFPLVEPAGALVADDAVRGLAAVDRALDHPDPWTRAMLRLQRALLVGNSGDMSELGRELEHAAEAFRQAGERWGLATSLTYLGSARSMLGDFERAIAALEESVHLLRELDPADDAIMQRAWIADAHRLSGDVERARAALLEMIGPGAGTPPRQVVMARITLGSLARQEGNLEEAGRQYEAARYDLDQAPFPDQVSAAMLLVGRGLLAVARGDTGSARGHLGAAFEMATGAADMPFMALVGVAVAVLARRRGDARRAAEALGAAHALRGAPDAFNPDVADLVADLRDEVGESDYESSYAAGRAMDRAAALALLEELLGVR